MLSMISILNDAGHSAHPVYPTPDLDYVYFANEAVTFHDARLAELDRTSGRAGEIRDWLSGIRRRAAPQRVRHPSLELRSTDIVVVPEFRYPELSTVYAANRRILLVQDVMGFARAQLRDTKRRDPVLGQFHAVITTSDAAYHGVRELAGIEPMRITLSVDETEFSFVDDKRLQIAVMPRKHPLQAEIVMRALQSDPELSDVPVVILQGMSREDLRRAFAESLIFLSFSKEEGFGLPPAEAMATGSIVIGYRGVGSVEYFDGTTGFPVEADDIATFIATTRRLIRQYREDPGPLDGIRRTASDFVLGTYTQARFRETTLRAFAEVAN